MYDSNSRSGISAVSSLYPSERGEQGSSMENGDDLSGLKNLGTASINILNAIGVKTPQDLQRMGSVKAYLKIKARGIRVSKVMLYALEGALLNIHWKELDVDIKARLLTEVENQEDVVT